MSSRIRTLPGRARQAARRSPPHAGDARADEAELIASRLLRPPPGEDFWIFAYGSLMWRPGFPFLDRQPALLRGYHRAFCIASNHYRGTLARPGLVLGLDRGGSCRGRVYRIAAAEGAGVTAYLHEREMITGVYEPRWLPVAIPGGQVTAAAYVADRRHGQYLGKLPEDRICAMILQGEGAAGTNRDYLENTVRHLDQLGIADCPLHRLHRLVVSCAPTRPPGDARI